MTDCVKREGWGYGVSAHCLLPGTGAGSVSISSFQSVSFSSKRTRACRYASTGLLIEELFFCQPSELQ